MQNHPLETFNKFYKILAELELCGDVNPKVTLDIFYKYKRLKRGGILNDWRNEDLVKIGDLAEKIKTEKDKVSHLDDKILQTKSREDTLQLIEEVFEISPLYAASNYEREFTKLKGGLLQFELEHEIDIRKGVLHKKEISDAQFIEYKKRFFNSFIENKTFNKIITYLIYYPKVHFNINSKMVGLKHLSEDSSDEFIVDVEYPKRNTNKILYHLAKLKSNYNTVDELNKIEYDTNLSKTYGGYPKIKINSDSDFEYIKNILDFANFQVVGS